MGHEFETSEEVEVPASPEQVWEAIATGPGIDSWFMGRNEVRPGAGGTVRMAFGGYTPESAVTAWQPGQRLAYGSEPAADGRFVAYEFLIEGRAGGSSVLRVVTSGFVPGDDWADEFEAMTLGNEMFFRTLVTYLTHFAGRTAVPLTVFGPPVADWDSAWAALRSGLGLSGPATEGDRARLAPDGRTAVEGIVYFTNEHTLGVRTADAFYRFLRGFNGPMVAAHQYFSPIDIEQAESAWRSWLDRHDGRTLR
ncbi:SRPBCC family protein [Qaidamihabitans albus]|uniref:SRPBCC family protein n=1 Tax=Qaidamihabitans albus TaxID=2795733 RepID=UPI0018F1737C|nr:SRPBCC domain-containing protein [Qaidamihabitans albus]